ncbi:MAG: long-chain-acyl-CoA synthetase, partial [Pseudomonadota bacterium]
SEYVRRELPAYAVPVFLRIQPEIDVTGTFKMVKGDLRKEGYNIEAFSDPVFVMKNGEQVYSELDDDYVGQIRQGQAGY